MHNDLLNRALKRGACSRHRSCYRYPYPYPYPYPCNQA